MPPATDTLTPAVEALESAIDGEVTRNGSLIQSYKDQVAALQALVDSGGLSADQEAALTQRITAVQAKIDALDVTSPTTAPTT